MTGRKAEDLAGRRFGMLTALSPAGGRRWLCRCDCGAEKEILAGNMKSGQSRSCGCRQKAGLAPRRARPYEHAGRSMGVAAWIAELGSAVSEKAVRERVKKGWDVAAACAAPKDDSPAKPGLDLAGRKFGMLTAVRRAPGRGKKARPAWFCLCDCGSPERSYWAQQLTGGRQTSCGCSGRRPGRPPAMLTVGGETLTAEEWAARSGLSGSTVRRRLRRGLGAEEAAGPKKRGAPLAHGGETLPVKEWAGRLGVAAGLIRDRLRLGWDVGRAVTEPPGRQGRRGKRGGPAC